MLSAEKVCRHLVDLTDLGAVRQQLDETFKLGQSEQSDTPEPSADSSAEHPEAQTRPEEVKTGIPPTEEATTSSTSEAVETQGEEELQTEEQEEQPLHLLKMLVTEMHYPLSPPHSR